MTNPNPQGYGERSEAYREMAEKLARTIGLTQAVLPYKLRETIQDDIEQALTEVAKQARREAIAEVVKMLYSNCSKLHCACRHVPEIEALAAPKKE